MEMGDECELDKIETENQYLQSCTEQSLGMVIVKYQEMPSL